MLRPPRELASAKATVAAGKRRPVTGYPGMHDDLVLIDPAYAKGYGEAGKVL
jgi:hypothetical protein